MKTGKLRKVTGFWKSLFFMGNVCKIRKCLMGYLGEEGLKCEFVDGEIIFEYNYCHFTISFVVNDGFSECHISYRCDDDDYEKLNMAREENSCQCIHIQLINTLSRTGVKNIIPPL